MTMIDTHTHLYLKEFDRDRKDMMKRAELAGVAQVLLPAVDAATHDVMFEMERDYPGVCKLMMGLHPCSVTGDYRYEMDLVEEHFRSRKFVAVGEIGLDFYWDRTFTEQQYVVFRRQLELAIQHGLPVSIHSRNATDECIEVVKEYKGSGLSGVFHCFSGSLQQAQAAIEAGFLLGIGGVVTFKNSGLDKIIPEIDLSHLVLETDAPYLAPVPYRGKRNESAYLYWVVEKLASLKGLTSEQIAKATTANAQKLFGI